MAAAHRSFVIRSALISILLLSMLGAQPVQRVHAATIMVTNTNDSGPGSLRQAITDAGYGDTITFDPLLAGQTITLKSDIALACSLVQRNFTIDGSGLFPQVIISGGNVAHMKFSYCFTVTISDVTITNSYGSAIESTGTLTLRNSTLKNNYSPTSGAAIRNGRNLTIENSTITQNQADYGGAIDVQGDQITTIINSTVTNNYGGGITIGGNALVEIINSTVANNSKGFPESELEQDGLSSVNLINSIFVCSPQNTYCYYYTHLNTIHSILRVGTLQEFGLADLADNGGPTQTMALLPGSSLIDAGDDSTCANNVVNNLDQRGVTRSQGVHCDIGAYEYRSTPTIHYVKKDATGANNGTSWNSAFNNLQSALSTASSGDEIWVAMGTYKPTTGADRTISFALKNGLAIYGGFAGTETSLAQRNYETNVTILSGDIGSAGTNSDNSYHVLVANGADNTILDGFTITSGNATGISPHDRGAGMYNNGSNPILRNLVFSNNSAAGGGGMYNNSSNPDMQNITFDGNRSTAYGLGGGGMLNTESNLNLTNIVFTNNSSFCHGGGMMSIYSSLSLYDVTFSKNSASTGGGMSNGAGNAILTNVTFKDNAAIDSSGYYGCSTAIGGGMSDDGNSTLTLNNVTFSNNSSVLGGGMASTQSNSNLESVTFVGNSAVHGGGMLNGGGTVILTNVTFKDNTATGAGGGMSSRGDYTLSKVTFVHNSASQGGGLANDGGHPSLVDVMLSNNSAKLGGGVYNATDTASSLSMRNVTLNNNSAIEDGGGIYNWSGKIDLLNVTFNANSANQGGGLYNFANFVYLKNTTFSGNNAATAGGGIYSIQSYYRTELNVTNSIIYGNVGGEIYDVYNRTGVTYSIVQGGYAGTGNLDADPLLGVLATNGGFTKTMATAPNSPAINAGTDFNCPETDQRGIKRPQGIHCDMGAYEKEVPVTITGNAWSDGVTLSYTDETRKTVQTDLEGNFSITVPSYWSGNVTPTHPCFTFDPPSFDYSNITIDQPNQNFGPIIKAGCANMGVFIGGKSYASYGVPYHSTKHLSYANVNNGPVKVISNSTMIASQRVAYSQDDGTSWTSFNEMMGMPATQLNSGYYFPWYNNVEMNTQLRFGNVGTSFTKVTVTIGGVVQGTYDLYPNQSMRISYAGLNNGPVKVASSGGVPIIASMRFAYIKSTDPLDVPGFSELMGLPSNQLTSTYIFPWYNNAEMNTQLRFGNVGTSKTKVTVTVGGVVQGTYDLYPNQSMRISYPNLNNGPVKVESSNAIVPIIASMRFVYIKSTDPLIVPYFSETLGLPQPNISTNYWFPIYDNVTHNMQLRFGNMGTTTTMVTVTIGSEVKGSYLLYPNQSVRVSYPNLNAGPVQVQSSSNVPIIASMRFVWIQSLDPLLVTAFSEMLGLPNEKLSTSYVFPWYNNAELDTQLRVAMP